MDACIITQDDFKKLESEWGQLLEACEKDNFFMSWKWLSVWWHRYGFDLEWLLIGVRDGEQLIGIAPLCIKKVLYKKCIALREIQFIGSGLICSEHLDFISLPGRHKEVLQKVCHFLFRDYKDWDIAKLTDIFIGSKTTDFFESQGAVIRNWTTCPFIGLPGTYEEYLKDLSKKARYNARKKVKNLEKAVSVEYGIADESNRFEVFNELKNLHNLRWQAKGMSGFFCDDTACSFHDEVIRQIPPENTELSYIKDRSTGAYLAIHYSFIRKQKVFLYQQGTNLDYHRFSPGIVLLVYNIKRYIEKGFEELDFMRGDEDYKFHWTRDCRPNIQVILFNHRKIKTRLLKKFYLLISN